MCFCMKEDSKNIMQIENPLHKSYIFILDFKMEYGSSHPSASGKKHLPNNISQKSLKLLGKKNSIIFIAHLNKFYKTRKNKFGLFDKF